MPYTHESHADMTYRQLMGILGEAPSVIHKGILLENKQLVRSGADTSWAEAPQ